MQSPSTVCLSVRPSMCVSVGIVSKWLNLGSRKQLHTRARDSSFLTPKILAKFQRVHPKRQPNAGAVGYKKLSYCRKDRSTRLSVEILQLQNIPFEKKDCNRWTTLKCVRPVSSQLLFLGRPNITSSYGPVVTTSLTSTVYEIPSPLM